MKPFVKYKISLAVIFSLFLCFQAWTQDIDDEFGKITSFFRTLNDFSRYIPQEKVYLHFDNTGYYQGDNIWFKCYVVTSGQHQLSQLSKTLYVELLNPGGEIIDKRILRIENGQCHGDFSLDQLPFYSGFYEVRAYTKYMLNFGEEVIFSRLLPVFDKPQAEGDFEEKKMLRFGRYGPLGSYSMKREQPTKEKAVNLRFFPEGGNLIQGVESRIAFEATDEVGNPIDVTGVILDTEKQALCPVATLHEGRGVFTCTPGDGSRKDVVEVEYVGKKYRFDLPQSLPQGVVMEADNFTDTDMVGVTLRKNRQTPVEMLGVAVISGGKLQNCCGVWIEDDEISFKIDKTQWPSGVTQIVLFNSSGEILCDRLVFNSKNDRLDIKVKTNKPLYYPCESAEIEISVSDRDANPVQATFSMSVRDGANEVEHNRNIMTDLLLMSEIKGYVRNPSYYFEKGDDDDRRVALDLLLMVQGWRRYSWNQMVGIEPLEIKYRPEKGIETVGKVVTLIGQKPRPNIDIDLFLLQRGNEDDETGGGFYKTFVTDEGGRFSFVSDVEGKWNMILTVSEAGKKKDHSILLDRVFSPKPRKYTYAELQVSMAEKNTKIMVDDEEMSGDTIDNDNDYDYAAFLIAYQDSLARLGINERINFLPEVTVKAKRDIREENIFHNRSTSVAYYDVPSEYDDFYDQGNEVGNNIHELLKNMNENFYTVRSGSEERLYYKGKETLIVVNYEKVDFNKYVKEQVNFTEDEEDIVIKIIEYEYFRYLQTRLYTIKSIYINENPLVMARYIIPPPLVSPQEYANRFSCVVFIETYPDGQIPVEGAKGVRKTWFEGYSAVQEFYSPDYSVLPPQPNDYRRTIYWNPTVTPDEAGKATIQFYNNSSCKKFNINVETVTSQGMIGLYQFE